MLMTPRPLITLDKLLPSDLGDIEQVSVNRGLSIDDEIQVRDAVTGEYLTRLGGIPKGSPGHMLRANRERFRDFLWKNIPVHTAKVFDHYTEDANGVTVYFKDSTVSRGAALIGCDGARSHIRGQLIGGKDSHPVLSSYTPIMGECDVSPEMHIKLAQHGNAGMLIGNMPGVRVLVGLRTVQPDMSSANWYFVLVYQTENPEAEAEWAEKATATELYEKVMAKTTGMYSLYTDLFEMTGPEGMVTHGYKFYEYVSPESLPYGRVTLLGDAAHSMIPMKGAGANTALDDACDLGKLIADKTHSGNAVQWPELLKEYERIMLPRGAEIVLASRRAGEVADGVTHLAQR